MNSIDTATKNLNDRLSEQDKMVVEVMTALFVPKLTEVIERLRQHNATDEQIAEVLAGVMARSVVKMRNEIPVH